MFRLVISNPRKQMKNGFERCRLMHPKVTVDGENGNYKVKGNENIYNVKFMRDASDSIENILLESAEKNAETCARKLTAQSVANSEEIRVIDGYHRNFLF